MNIFEEVKSRTSVKGVAEAYGLKVGRNGMACCPFHKDKHPSMKVEANHYQCFGCGVHGDVIDYVARLFETSQYDAALKINTDFNLGIDVHHKPSETEQSFIKKRTEDSKKVADIQSRFREWKLRITDELLECEHLIKECEDFVMHEAPHVVFISNAFMYMMHTKAFIGYLLDILCLGTEDEAKELLLTEGKEVKRIAENIKRAGDEILGRNRKCVR